MHTPLGTVRRFEDEEKWLSALLAAFRDGLACGRDRPPIIGCTGGRTPYALYDLVAEQALIDLSVRKCLTGAHALVADERPEVLSSSRSNSGQLAASWSELPLTVHTVNAASQDADRHYTRLLQQVTAPDAPAFDLLILGMGTDGHVASLFPGTAALDYDRPEFLLNDVPQQGEVRLTASFPLLASAGRRLMLCRGPDKIQTLDRLLSGEMPDAPVWRLAEDGGPELEWFVLAD